MKKQRKKTLAVIAVLALAAAGVRANNLAVTNVTVAGIDDSTANIQFDISWENAWRYTNINHDAAWVFFKVLPQGDTENDWQHAILESSGHDAGSGTSIDIIVPDDGMGLFIRKADAGVGDVAVTGVKAVWNFSSNGWANTAMVRVQAFALEMVYVAEGAFAAGSGGTGANEFTLTTISTNDPTVVPTGTGSLGGKAGGYPEGQTAPNASWPNGYSAFYCMKYETTQGQYTDFLNTLTDVQDDNRYYSGAGSRYTITGSFTNYSTAEPDRACIRLSWDHGAAFADWSGLRPMTELEYEKACRGPLPPVANEYAWGSVNITKQTGHSGTDGSGTETATPSGANSCWGNAMGGAVRAGIYATASSSREAAGASYWAIMELSGNVWEATVTIGSAAGRGFTGLHGNGVLTAAGAADVANWTGGQRRGGSWYRDHVEARVSDRQWYITATSTDHRYSGWRGVRTAPAGVEP
jgi:formylglycine-generating enzyme required for sulfatase activity